MRTSLQPRSPDEGGRVLCVDDDPAAARGMRRVLRQAGLDVEVVHSGDEALDRVKEKDFGVIVSDLRMPGMDGASLVSAVCEIRPEQTFVIVTGAAELDLELDGVPESSVLSVVAKPWDALHLVEVVRRSLRMGAERQRVSLPGVAVGLPLLVLEDDPADVALTKAYLDASGVLYAPYCYTRLGDALESFSQRAYRGALVDLNLPDARGLDVVRALHAAAPDLPLVVLSGLDDETVAAETLEMGAEEYLLKHEIDPRRLRRALEHASRRKRAEQKLAYLAFHDQLTGLSNARHLRDRLGQALGRCSRRGTACALLFLDLDGFKEVNDTYGHDAGDRLLQFVAQRLHEAVREYDTLARLGGDEFAVLLEDVTARQSLVEVAERVLAALRRPIPAGQTHVEVSASVGIATYPQAARGAEALLKAADVAMYEAKADGPGCYRFSANGGDDDDRPSHNGRLIDQLHVAFENRAFQLAYQPLFDVQSLKVVSYESLIRWQLPSGEWIPPLQFIPLLEEADLMEQVGLWVVETALRERPALPTQGANEVRISVNVAPKQFEAKDFAEQVVRRLQETNTPAHLLELEITERLLMQDTEAVQHNMRALREAGVRLAVDDFGVGYASLTYLRRFALDTLKIDRSFVNEAEKEEGAAALVRGVVRLAQELGLEVTAEGVETQAQLELLKRIGCDICQGYLLGRPALLAQLQVLAVGT